MLFSLSLLLLSLSLFPLLSGAPGCLEIQQSIFSLLSRSSLPVCFLLPGGLEMWTRVLLVFALSLPVLLKFPPLIFCFLSGSLALSPCDFLSLSFSPPPSLPFDTVFWISHFLFLCALFIPFSPAPSFTFAVNRSNNVSAHRQACC